MRKEYLQRRAAYVRNVYLKKPIGKSNVAIAFAYLFDGLSCCAEATSKGKGPIAQPPPAQSEGGQFEPSVDSRTNRLMNTDAEYKVLSAIAEDIEIAYYRKVEGSLYLYTELQPCESCRGVLRQFKEKFPNISIKVFWDYPYP